MRCLIPDRCSLCLVCRLFRSVHIFPRPLRSCKDRSGPEDPHSHELQGNSRLCVGRLCQPQRPFLYGCFQVLEHGFRLALKHERRLRHVQLVRYLPHRYSIPTGVESTRHQSREPPVAQQVDTVRRLVGARLDHRHHFIRQLGGFPQGKMGHTVFYYQLLPSTVLLHHAFRIQVSVQD